METLVPVNMRDAVQNSLDRLGKAVGSIDDYVANRLDYSAADLPLSFAAEQIDAITLALFNIERGAAFTIGDQTGIGKGRVKYAYVELHERMTAEIARSFLEALIEDFPFRIHNSYR